MENHNELLKIERYEEMAVIRSVSSNKALLSTTTDYIEDLMDFCRRVNSKFRDYEMFAKKLAVTEISIESDLIQFSNGSQAIYCGIQDDACFNAETGVFLPSIEIGLEKLSKQKQTARETKHQPSLTH